MREERLQEIDRLLKKAKEENGEEVLKEDIQKYLGVYFLEKGRVDSSSQEYMEGLYTSKRKKELMGILGVVVQEGEVEDIIIDEILQGVGGYYKLGEMLGEDVKEFVMGIRRREYEGNVPVLGSWGLNTGKTKIKKLKSADVEVYKESDVVRVYDKLEELESLLKESEHKRGAEECVSKIIQKVLSVYDVVYAPCYIEKAQGVLSAEGIKVDKRGGIDNLNYAKYLQDKEKALYSEMMKGVTLEGGRGDIELEELTLEDVDKGVYLYAYHTYNIMGIDSKSGERYTKWGEYREKLEERLRDRLYGLVLERMEAGGDLTKLEVMLIRMLTTVIVIQKLDTKKALQMLYHIKGADKEKIGVVLQGSDSILGDKLQIMSNKYMSNSDVVSFLGVFDKRGYDSEILFAYKAHEKMMAAGEKSSIKSVVLGRKLDGSMEKINLESTTAITVGIVAGSQSGKGTMTLNILANIIASGCPFIYLDNKPDMGGMLWDVEREMGDERCKIFSVDNLENKYNGMLPPRYYPNGYKKPKYLEDIEPTVFQALPYIKTLQLVTVLAKARVSELIPKDKKFFVICDELEKYCKTGLVTLINSVTMKKPGKDATNEENMRYEYCTRLLDIVENSGKNTGVYVGVNEVQGVTGGKANVGFIYLGQQTEASAWKVTELGYKFFMGSTCRIIGKNAGMTGAYSFNAQSKVYTEIINSPETFGYWAYVPGTKPTGNEEAFKSYLVLNDNDYDDVNKVPGEYTGKLLGNIQDPMQAQQVVDEELHIPGGGKREAIGFLGLIKYISAGDEEVLKENLGKGYAEMWELMQLLGLDTYSCIEEYLYDCSFESLFTIPELVGKMNGAGTEKPQEVEEIGWVDTPVQKTEGLNVNRIEGNSDMEGGEDELGGIEEQEDIAEQEYLGEEGIEEGENVGGVYPPYTPQTQKTAPKQTETVGSRTRRKVSTTSVISPHIGGVAIPFKKGEGLMGNIVDLQKISGIILEDIGKQFGGLDRITSVEIYASGVVVLNGKEYRPTFDEKFYMGLPMAIQHDVSSGSILELLYLGDIYKFKNLTSIGVEDERVLNGRMRQEMGLPKYKRFNYLFKRFRSLVYINVGGVEYREGQEEGETEKVDRLEEKFKLGAMNPHIMSRMGGIWESRPVKAVTGALGWTLGIKAVVGLAGIMGPWGMLFGALAVAGSMKGR